MNSMDLSMPIPAIQGYLDAADGSAVDSVETEIAHQYETAHHGLKKP